MSRSNDNKTKEGEALTAGGVSGQTIRSGAVLAKSSYPLPKQDDVDFVPRIEAVDSMLPIDPVARRTLFEALPRRASVRLCLVGPCCETASGLCSS